MKKPFLFFILIIIILAIIFISNNFSKKIFRTISHYREIKWKI